MTRERAPTRLSELRDDESSGLRRALTAARRTGPDAGARARIAAGVAATLEGSANAAPARPAHHGAPLGPLALASGLTGLAAISLVAVIAARGPSRAPAPPAAPLAAATPARPAPPPAPPAAAAIPSPQPAALVAETPRLPVRPLLPRHAPPRAATTATSTHRVAVATEGDLLRRAQAALPDAPTRALGLVQEHATLYPTGALAQERDVISIEALLQLDRREQARAAAHRFLRQHPDSPHRGHVEVLLGRSQDRSEDPSSGP